MHGITQFQYSATLLYSLCITDRHCTVIIMKLLYKRTNHGSTFNKLICTQYTQDMLLFALTGAQNVRAPIVFYMLRFLG